MAFAVKLAPRRPSGCRVANADTKPARPTALRDESQKVLRGAHHPVVGEFIRWMLVGPRYLLTIYSSVVLVRLFGWRT